MTDLEKYYNNLLINSGYFPTFFLLLPIVAAIWKWQILNQPLRYFFWYCFWLFTFNVLVLAFIWSTSKHYQLWKPLLDTLEIKNVFFTRILFFLNDFIYLGSCFLLFLLPKNKIKYQKIIIIILCLLSIFMYFLIDGVHEYGTLGRQLGYIFILLLTLVTLYLQFKTNTNQSIFRNSFFWISLGLLIPRLINILFEFSANNLYETDYILYCKIHIFTNMIEVFGQVFFVFGFINANHSRYFMK